MQVVMSVFAVPSPTDIYPIPPLIASLDFSQEPTSMTEPTHYDNLDLTLGASEAAIHRAFVLISLTHHPNTLDQHITEAQVHEKLDRYEDALYAYKILRDPRSRQEYDNELRQTLQNGDQNINNTPPLNRTRVYRRTVNAEWSLQATIQKTGWISSTPMRAHFPNLLETHIWTTDFAPPFEKRTPHREELNCLWKENKCRYTDCNWDIALTLNPAYARFGSFSARNTFIYENNDGRLGFCFHDLVFATSESDAETRKNALRVEIRKQPSHGFRICKMRNSLVPKVRDGSRGQRVSLVLAVWTKPRHRTEVETWRFGVREFDVGEEVVFTTNAAERWAVRAGLSRKTFLGK
jgi:curved DNA-binding protein CbpA